MNRDLRRAYNSKIGKYRFKQIDKYTKLFEICFWDLSMSSGLMQMTFPETSKVYFEVYPYRYYWVRSFLWRIRSIIGRQKMQKKTAINPKRSLSLLEKSGIRLGIIVSLILVYEFIIKTIYRYFFP